MYKRMIALALSLMLALLGSVCLAEERGGGRGLSRYGHGRRGARGDD